MSMLRAHNHRLWWLIGLALWIAAGWTLLAPTLLASINRQLARHALETHRPAQAAQYAQQALVWQPRDAALFNILGTAYSRQGQWVAALDAYAQAVVLDEDLAVARNNFGVVLIKLGHADKAVDWLGQAARLNPASAEIFTNLGNAYRASNEPVKAADAYRRGMELDAAHVEARSQWAGLAFDAGRLVDARRAWEAAAVVDPAWPGVLRGLGAVAVREGRPRDALPYLQQALRANPNDVTTNFYLGLAYEALNRPAEALDAFERALVSTAYPEQQRQAREHLFAIVHGSMPPP